MIVTKLKMQFKKDNPFGRQAQELKMLKSPKTGKIPYQIRKKELIFAKSKKAKLKLNNTPRTHNKVNNRRISASYRLHRLS